MATSFRLRLIFDVKTSDSSLDVSLDCSGYLGRRAETSLWWVAKVSNHFYASTFCLETHFGICYDWDGSVT